jgi:hypothetical protein
MLKKTCVATAALFAALLCVLLTASAGAQAPIVVAVPASAGAVVGTNQNSDQFIWTLFTQFAAPVSPTNSSQVVFETWASDADTFSTAPHWPAPGEPKKLRASVLRTMKLQSHAIAPGVIQKEDTEIDVPCATPGNAAIGNFPVMGPPTPCIGEEVRRNRPQWDYIVNKKLNTQTGLAAAYAKGLNVQMPTSAISVKGDWVPVITLQQWIPQLGSTKKIESLYYTTTSGSVEYALVSLHVSSRQNPNWVWGTFEHEMNPGRCDSIGCQDTFGAQIRVVRPNLSAWNTQYGVCTKTAALKTMMNKAKLSPVWDHYCLKSSQVDYVNASGIPMVLGNSVIERIVGNGGTHSSSCIGCHVYASFTANGQASASATEILPYNPIGKPAQTVLNNSHQFDFMWGVLLAPK